MPTSEELRVTSLQEFEFAFGEIIRELPGGDAFYGYFSDEFLKGVAYGLATPQATNDSIEVEAALHHLVAAPVPAGLDPIEAGARRSAIVIFKYGATWAVNLLRNAGE